MAGIDTDIQGEARPQAGIKIGYLAQEPQLNTDKDVRGNVEEGLSEAIDALAGLDRIYAAYRRARCGLRCTGKGAGKARRYYSSNGCAQH